MQQPPGDIKRGALRIADNRETDDAGHGLRLAMQLSARLLHPGDRRVDIVDRDIAEPGRLDAARPAVEPHQEGRPASRGRRADMAALPSSNRKAIALAQ